MISSSRMYKPIRERPPVSLTALKSLLGTQRSGLACSRCISVRLQWPRESKRLQALHTSCLIVDPQSSRDYTSTVHRRPVSCYSCLRTGVHHSQHQPAPRSGARYQHALSPQHITTSEAMCPPQPPGVSVAMIIIIFSVETANVTTLQGFVGVRVS